MTTPSKGLAVRILDNFWEELAESRRFVSEAIRRDREPDTAYQSIHE